MNEGPPACTTLAIYFSERSEAEGEEQPEPGAGQHPSEQPTEEDEARRLLSAGLAAFPLLYGHYSERERVCGWCTELSRIS
jgi:hypothetical protein